MGGDFAGVAAGWVCGAVGLETHTAARQADSHPAIRELMWFVGVSFGGGAGEYGVRGHPAFGPRASPWFFSGLRGE